MIALAIMVGIAPQHQIILNFILVKEVVSYNMILERPILNTLKVVCSTLHPSLKFPIPIAAVKVLADAEV